MLMTDSVSTVLIARYIVLPNPLFGYTVIDARLLVKFFTVHRSVILVPFWRGVKFSSQSILCDTKQQSS